MIYIKLCFRSISQKGNHYLFECLINKFFVDHPPRVYQVAFILSGQNSSLNSCLYSVLHSGIHGDLYSVVQSGLCNQSLKL